METIGKLTGKDLETIASSELSVEELASLAAAIEVGFQKNNFSRLCRAHFLSQVAHESGHFLYWEELGSIAYFEENYEGRSDLGNTEPGDGAKFFGRGLIQVTGRANYTEYGKYSGFDAIGKPEELARFPHVVDSAFWYWNTRSLSEIADRDDVELLTRRINGGLNGFDDRCELLKLTKSLYKL